MEDTETNQAGRKVSERALKPGTHSASVSHWKPELEGTSVISLLPPLQLVKPAGPCLGKPGPPLAQRKEAPLCVQPSQGENAAAYSQQTMWLPRTQPAGFTDQGTEKPS